MAVYELDPDKKKGFRTAVENGQTRLALEYAVGVIEDLQAEVNLLKSPVVTPVTLLPETPPVVSVPENPPIAPAPKTKPAPKVASTVPN